MTDLIIDAESLGQSVFTCPVVNFSIFKFDPQKFKSDEPYSYDEVLNNIVVFKLNVTEQVKKYGYIIEKSSLSFWEKRPDDVRKQITPSSKDLYIDEFCTKFIAEIENDNIKYWWSRSNTFDPVLLYRLFNTVNLTDRLNKVLKFWRVRDIRTFIDAKADFALDFNAFIPIDEKEWKEKFKEHDSKHDVTADVLRMQRLVRIENGLK